MKKALPAWTGSFGPCDCCGRPAQVGTVDHLEMYPVQDEEGGLWRTLIALGEVYYRCRRHDPKRRGNRTSWSIHEDEDPFQSREALRAYERRVYSIPVPFKDRLYKPIEEDDDDGPGPR